MASPTISRGRYRSRSATRSPTPRSYHSRSPSVDRRSPSAAGGRPHRSPAPRRNGVYRDGSRSPSRSPSPSRSRSRTRSYSRDRDGRPRSRSRSESPGLKSTKIVVERLTKNVNEDHLHEIFGQYGEVRDLDLPVNRQFGTNRGTAYILYAHEADAEAAIAHMHEAQLDGAVINVSIVLPRRKFSPSPPLARRGANFNPRHPPPGGRPSGTGQQLGGTGGRGRRQSPPAGTAGRYGPRSDTYRPCSVSRSRSRSPLLPASGSRRYHSRSPSYTSRSRSRTPPARGRGGRGGGRRYNGHGDRRSPSRGSYDGYDRRSRSRSREWSRR